MRASEALTMHFPTAELQFLHRINRFITDGALVRDGLLGEKIYKACQNQVPKELNESSLTSNRSANDFFERWFVLREAPVKKANLAIASESLDNFKSNR